MLDHCLWLSITLIEYGTTGITSRDCDTPMLWVAWHVESGEGIISMLGMGASILKYQNMPFIWILLSQDIHGSSTLCKKIVIREIAILILPGFESDASVTNRDTATSHVTGPYVYSSLFLIVSSLV